MLLVKIVFLPVQEMATNSFSDGLWAQTTTLRQEVRKTI